MWEKLQQASKPIFLYGMGDGADKVLARCQELNIPIAGVFASDGFVRHNSFHSFTVVSYAEARQQAPQMIVLVCFGTHLPEVMEQIRRISQEQELYLPDLPVAGQTFFDEAFYQAHRSELQQVSAQLADERSRQIFQDLIAYKRTGQLQYLDRSTADRSETYRQLLQPGTQEHYADLGAYRGDTVEEFLSYTDQWASILAVEPEPHSFKKLAKATAELPNCRCVQAVMADAPGEVLFSAGRGRGSAAGKGGTSLPAESLDHLMQGRPVTLLKVDVEGQEAAVLQGAQQTISRWRPKILLSAYHRSEDLFALPLQVLQMRPDYRLYLRRYPCYPAWENKYIFV